MKNVAVIANTAKLSKEVSRQLKSALGESGWTVDWLSIKKGSAGKDAARSAVKKGADVVIVCGGDGTVRAAAEALVGSDVPLAVVPAGTANLFATAMGLPIEPAGVVALIQAGSLRTIDTGVCNGQTFNVMAGAGFDAAMLDAAEDDKERLGTLAYVRAGARQARERKPFEVGVTIDGRQVFDGSATCVLVGNLSELKGGVKVFADSSPTDGLLDIGVITAAGAREWAGLVLSAVTHRQRFSGRVELFTGQEVSVKFGSKHRFELDGGVKGRSKHLDFTIKPSSLVICAPRD